MEEIERILLAADKEAISELCEKLATVTIYEEAISLMTNTCKKEEPITNGTTAPTNGHATAPKTVTWSVNENQLLIKASLLHPTGSVDRWNLIASYINEHCSDKTRKPKTDKDVIRQSKAVQSMEFKPVTNQHQLGSGIIIENGTAPKTVDEDGWADDEQKKLESALKSFPASDPERWDKIASHVATKSKKECVRRYKKLAELVKSRRNAS